MSTAASLSYGPYREAARDAIVTLAVRGFHGSRERVLRFLEKMGPDPYRVVYDGDQPVARLVRLDMAHWFGGRPVRSAGIGGVAVAPERRGDGVGRLLMAQALREARDDGFALSTLFPATLSFYRKLGYERGGMHCQWETDLGSLAGVRSRLRMRPGNGGDRPAIERLQEAQARREHGSLRRAPIQWMLALKAPDDDAETWIVEDGGEPRGYFAMRADNGAEALEFCDAVFADGAAADAALSFAAGHRTQLRRLRWSSGPDHLLVLRLPEGPLKPLHWSDWFLRIVDVEAAFGGRGYPEFVTSTLTFAVEDPLLAENAGAWRLELSGGEGRVVRTDAAPEVRLGIGAVAALYSGRLSLAALCAAGLAQADAAAQAKAAVMFAGPMPSMTDAF